MRASTFVYLGRWGLRILPGLVLALMAGAGLPASFFRALIVGLGLLLAALPLGLCLYGLLQRQQSRARRRRSVWR